MNFISTIWRDGAAINFLKYCKTNKESIIKFLRFLFDFITETKRLVPSEVGIVWDNWSPHRDKSVKKFWKEMNAKIYHPPPYSPELALVEIYFSKLKADFIKQIGDQSVKLDSDGGIQKLKLWIESISESYVKLIWSKTYSQMISHINNSILK